LVVTGLKFDPVIVKIAMLRDRQRVRRHVNTTLTSCRRQRGRDIDVNHPGRTPAADGLSFTMPSRRASAWVLTAECCIAPRVSRRMAARHDGALNERGRRAEWT
jgi:hypothetical protein